MRGRAESGGRRAGIRLAAAVLVVGLTVSIGAGAIVELIERHSADQIMDRRSLLAATAVTTEVRRYLDTLRTVAAAIGTESQLTEADYLAATAPLADARLVAATSVAFVVPATDQQVPAVQATWRQRSSTDLVLQPVGTGQEHLFAVFVRQLDGRTPAAAGTDVSQVTEATQALDIARGTGQPAVSDTYVLLRDRNLPPRERQLSFVLAAPVRTSAGGGGFRGWIVMGMRGQDFVNGVVRQVTQGVVDVALSAQRGNGQAVQVAALHTTAEPDLFRSAEIPVADRHWTLRTSASSATLLGAAQILPVGMAGALTGTTLLLAGLVWVLATGRDRARAQVVAATADLRSAEQDARRQADLLGTILETLTEGVGVVNERGEFLVHNPAAKKILGIDEDVNGAEAWQEHYGIFRPDGMTPFPTEDLPMVRALHGEATDDVEMVIRNPGRPEGLLILVSGRPLAEVGGAPGAMAIFRDITAERAHENDLTAFAGVVAHDLKSPLATIGSYAELTAEEIDERLPGPEGTAARESLGRVLTSVIRAGQLIDDLLAYTTAREAELNLRTVDVDQLVEEVVAERTGHLRAGTRQPEISVGPLGKATADASMLRRVLDNLIGNAIKYVPDGEPPRIRVSARPDSRPGWIRLEICDRGIGIPDADKPRVFEAFHRAHGGSRYAGTGLGLAICRRIMERHGGTISVADNPGGGTCFLLTLPAG